MTDVMNSGFVNIPFLCIRVFVSQLIRFSELVPTMETLKNEANCVQINCLRRDIASLALSGP